MERHFLGMLEARWAADYFACVGFDSKFAKIPQAAHRPGNECAVSTPNTIVAFNCGIVDAIRDSVCAFKPNIGFYAGFGDEGILALRRTIDYMHTAAPEIPVILDAKRGDIGDTNLGYIEEVFDYFRADAVTVHPYLGGESLQPFLDRGDKGIFVLCRTSNKGAGEFQDLSIAVNGQFGPRYYHGTSNVPLYEYVANRVVTKWNDKGNCGLVVGATFPKEMKGVREIASELPLLIPGIGKQGGDLEATVKAADGRRMIINSSSGIIFASNGDDFAEAARRETIRLHDLITQYRGAMEAASAS